MSTIPLKPEKTIFTDQQWEAIHSADSNILISASAGSGKTMVLVNRIIEQIKNGRAIDELLVVTFTNAAAQEMKQRIQSAIQKEINADPEYETRHHLVEQLPKLGHANISTLHSFCLEVIERYYYLIDFDPVFRLLTDETEISIIKEDVWNDLIEVEYEKQNKSFISFMESYSGARSDEVITKMIFKLHEFSRANESPKDWLSSLSDLYSIPSGKLEKSRIYKDYLKKKFIEDIDYMLELINQAIDLSNGEEHLENQIKIFKDEKNQYEQINRALEMNQLDKVYEIISKGYTFSRLNAPRKKDIPEEIKELFHDELKDLRNEAKDYYQKFEKYFALSPTEQVKIIEETKEHVETLADLTENFTNDYQKYKEERKILDFNDLEHLTLKILRGNDGLSEPSKYYQNKFSEVLVDEYQDINGLQEAILLHLTRPSDEVGNYFMVGDVKQSIYGFRLANPGLFLKKYQEYGQNINGKRIILAENFRSRENILSFTNFIFTQLMDIEVGNLDYDKNAELVYGNQNFDYSDKFDTEILIYEKEEEEETSFIDSEIEVNEQISISHKTTGEILVTASKIKELIENDFEIYDKKLEKNRIIDYRDIVLLTPTKMNNLEIQEIFQEAGIPTAINETQNFFQTTEVTIMMSLLKIIDNPKQDIPLVAVLRSPIVGLNEIELTYIRLQNRQVDFYDAMLEYADAEFVDSKNIELQKKIKLFLKDLKRWRAYARKHSVVSLLRMLYRETGYTSYVSGMSGGKQRKANLEALYQRAATYENTSFKGLYRFIRFIDKMQERDKDLAEPISIIDGQNAVRVMTVHASKGLEFPVVFLMDMSKRFNHSDWTGSYVFDQQLGIGLEYKNADDRIRTSTFVDLVIKDVKKKNGYAEQMRLLYVALTRAEQKLFLVGTSKNKEEAFKKWDKGNLEQNRILPENLRLNTNNFMDWVGMSLARHNITKNDVSLMQINEEIKKYPVNFSIQFYSEEDIIEKLNKYPEEEISREWLEELKKQTINLNLSKEVSDKLSEAIDIINYEYPDEAAIYTTSYQSVSEVKQLFEEPNNALLNKIDWTDEKRVHRYTSDLFERPKFLQKEVQPTGAEIGQATHLLLQKLELEKGLTIEKIKSQMQIMVEDGVLRKEVADKINFKNIAAFYQTTYGQELISYSEHIEKEVLFSLSIDASEIFKDMKNIDDSILIHGIIDGYYEREDGLVLFDYKTDRLKHLGALADQELIKRYQSQILLYKEALETITNKSVVEMNLISLDLVSRIEVKW